MPELAHQRCFNHALREAAALCTTCRSYFCRECIAEHAGRILCAACLKRELETKESAGRAFAGLIRLAEACVGILILWLSFYALGRVLLAMPHDFHEGTLWRESWILDEVER